MLKIAFSTISCPDWVWNDLLRYGPEFGYDGVEIRLLDRETDLLKVPDFQSSQLATRRQELSDAGFQICGLASSVRFDYPDNNQRKEQLEIGRAYLDLAVELEAGFVRVFGDVIQSGSLVAPTHALEGRVNALYGDYSVQPPQAVLEVELFLVADPLNRSAVVFHEQYREAIPLDDRKPESLVRGWNTGLTRALGELERDLASLELQAFHAESGP